MSKDDDAVFPPDWDWQKYEPAVREEAAQRHIQNEVAEIVSPADLEAIQSKMLTWRDQQKKAGLLPTDAEITSKGAEYARIFDNLVKKGVEILPEGLFAAGNEYLYVSRLPSQAMNDDRFLVERCKRQERGLQRFVSF